MRQNSSTVDEDKNFTTRKDVFLFDANKLHKLATNPPVQVVWFVFSPVASTSASDHIITMARHIDFTSPVSFSCYHFPHGFLKR